MNEDEAAVGGEGGVGQAGGVVAVDLGLSGGVKSMGDARGFGRAMVERAGGGVEWGG